MTTSSSPTSAAALTGLPVRRLSVADLAACADLAEDRGWAREEHKWRLLLTAGQGYGVDAPPGDQGCGLIGVYVLTSYGNEFTCVSMVLVAERHARRGLGRRLMEHALAESGGLPCFLSATVYGRPLYEQLGFTAVGSIVTLRGHFSGFPGFPGFSGADDSAEEPASVVPVRRATAADLPSIIALDAPAFGTDRTELLARLPAFADRLVVAETAHGTLTGFAAAWPNTHETVLGPVVAEDLPTAQALIADLGTHAPGRIRFDVDSRHPELDVWLRAHGLSGDFTCTLMIHSAPDLPGDITRRFAPYSVALG
ncbi:GNAT family N-acetyltransferase [Streptomyces daliensis]